MQKYESIGRIKSFRSYNCIKLFCVIHHNKSATIFFYKSIILCHNLIGVIVLRTLSIMMNFRLFLRSQVQKPISKTVRMPGLSLKCYNYLHVKNYQRTYHHAESRWNGSSDCLYRISLKALIYNDAGQMSLKRELYEEVGYKGDLHYQLFDAS